MSLRQHPFFIKLFQREYWPMWATYFPAFFYYGWLSLKARTPFWFSAANPNIKTGGMMGESKMDVLRLIPDAYKPTSVFVAKGTPPADALALARAQGIDFPMIVKPDVGERGTLVARVADETAFAAHLTRNAIDFIIQPYIDYKVELAIMYWLPPNENRLEVISVTEKAFLSVVGDGKNTILALVMRNARAILQLPKLKTQLGDRLHSVLPNGERLELEPIGNHARGTMFLNGNYLIDKELTNTLYRIASQIEGVYFGRFDLRCRSVDDLKRGEHIAILELNGVGAEPAHIYDPSHSLWATWRDILRYWRLMYRLSSYNHRVRGVPYLSWSEARSHWRALQAYRRGLVL